MTHATAIPPLCHPDPQLRGGAPGCPYIVPCTQRCHIRWLDGDDQLTTNPTQLTDTRHLMREDH
ncbi:hypothetical protein QTQ03_17740 [Micromonospora sp. WMMA1363]|uniref:hypothetical protein n=1 Tax=Micromonospora sp. WMMA1363 TaxID=3053985 RepID=UPI00259D010D|nr:hypothetical protein [Micromonospora sp. WMMA1363]MDM4721355.1 hypothetical protein [Micromonospora sp. WMMA1363]